MDSVRINFNNCGEQTFSSFIKNLNDGGCEFKAHNPADATVLQDRFTFLKNGQRISIVYETKAQTLIITAPQSVMDDLLMLLPPELSKQDKPGKAQKQEQPKQDKQGKAQKQEQSKQDKQGKAQKQEQPKQDKQGKAQKQEQPKQDKQGKAQKQEQPKQDKQGKAQKQEQPKQDKQGKTQKQEPPKQSKAPSKDKDGSEVKQEGKVLNTFTIKKVQKERFDELLKKVKANKNMKYKLISSNEGIKVYLIRTATEKATLKFTGADVQLGGARGNLYSELQLMMSQISDYKTAINSHIESMNSDKKSEGGKRPSEVERQLKKMLPAAFEFLSEQSKIDLAIGIIDINNSAVVLSDYSTLLIPCFRGLERLIFDLQHAQGIVVKMIGQAYEKEDGNYVLKSGYRRRIPSVIYAEVMASLYTEYFKQRNFYAHSDGGYDNLSRIISDKQQVQTIFNHILEVINYNGKKLKEIGFRIK